MGAGKQNQVYNNDRDKLTVLMEEEKYDLSEEIIQNTLYDNAGDESFLLYSLGRIYEKQNKLLEAKDAYLTAVKYALPEDEIMCKEALARISNLDKRNVFSKADYAKALNKVVSVYCYGRSGSQFFKSLLDNHPQLILTMLNGIKIFALWDKLIKDKGLDVFTHNIDYVISCIFETFDSEFNEGKETYEAKLNGMCDLGEDRSEIYFIDRDIFKKEFIEIINSSDNINSKFFYQTVQLAASYALGRQYDFSSGIPVIIEGGIHFGTSVDATQNFINIFPYTRLIHMVRNPVIAFAASLKFLIQSNQSSIDNLIASISVMFSTVPMKKEWANRTRIIKLEELHTNSEDILMRLCYFLQIDWSDTLLQSTFGGIKWWNTSTSEVLSGFNTKTISKTYEDILSSFDKFRLELLLQGKYRTWEYGTFECTRSDSLKDLYKEPFRFEEFFVQNEEELKLLRRILYKLMIRQFEYERDVTQEDRLDNLGRLLQRKKEVLV